MNKNSTIEIPVVGDGATYTIGADAYPYTVVAVSPTGSRITIQRDTALFDRLTGEYTYVRDNTGRVEEYSLRKTDRYVRVGTPSPGYGFLRIGARRYYLDPSF